MTRSGRIRLRITVLAAAAAAAGALALALPAPGEGQKAAAGSPAWESMKTLQGEWEGTYGGKEPVKVTYRLVSRGSALMESLSMPDGAGMVTMYHMDGPSLAMTHYCSENNQPRMRAAGNAATAKRIAFSYVDATNLPTPDAPRMSGLVVTILDADHFTQEWTHSGGGRSETSKVAFTRKK